MADPTLKNFIDGEYVAAAGDGGFDVVDPATEKSYATSPVSNAADVDTAFRAAATAFETWSETTPAEEQVPTDTTAPDRRALTRHRWWVAFWAVAAAASLTFGTWSIVHEVTVHNAQVRDSCLAMIADAATPDPTFWRWVEVTSPLPRSCARFVGQQ